MRLPGLFVVGTDTGVGKTRVATTIARSWRLSGHRVGVLQAEWLPERRLSMRRTLVVRTTRP